MNLRRPRSNYLGTAILATLAIGGGVYLTRKDTKLELQVMYQKKEYDLTPDKAELFERFRRLPIQEQEAIVSGLEARVSEYDTYLDEIITASQAKEVKFLDIKSSLDPQTVSQFHQANSGLDIAYLYNSILDVLIKPDNVTPEERLIILLVFGYTQKSFIAHENLHRYQHLAKQKTRPNDPPNAEDNLIRELNAQLITPLFHDGDLTISHNIINLGNIENNSRLLRLLTAVYGYFSDKPGNIDLNVAEFVASNSKNQAGFAYAFGTIIPNDKAYRLYHEKGFSVYEIRSKILEKIRETTAQYLREKLLG